MKKNILLLYLFFSAFILRASDTLVLNGRLTEEHVLRGSYLEILEDKSAHLTIEDILRDSLQSKFKTNQDPAAYNKNPQSAYWLKFTAQNNSKDFNHYILESWALNTKNLQLYYVDEQGEIHEDHTGEAVNYSDRTYRHKNLTLNLPMPESGKVRTFYIRVHSNLASSFEYHIKSLSWFVYYSHNEYILLGLYYGILLIMMLYNLIIFFTIRARVHLFYVFYIGVGIFASLNEDKIGYQYLWPGYPEINPFLAYQLTPFLLFFSFVIYSVEFLEMRKWLPKFFKALMISSGAYVLLFAVNFVFPLGHTLRVFYVIPFLIIYVASIYSFVSVKSHSAARLFVIGATFIFASIVLIQLRSMGYMPGNIFTVYLLNYSLVIESVILSIALSERIKGIQKEREIAQQKVIEELEEVRRLQAVVNEQLKEKQLLQEKVNRELEQKVQERTIELQKANEEISRMNELLYADNQKLQINLKELAKARVMLKGVDFEEFSKIYPDEDSCYKFLSELKWKQGYTCRKCGHENFCEGQTSFSKRCTRCRYDESPTAYTIFQGIKFPLNKAFYILFLYYSSKEKLTSTEISRILFLRQKTCWSFMNKIAEAGKNKTPAKKKKAEGWAGLVLD